jgi:hypothetical protein
VSGATEDRPEIVAALLWDVPALRRAGQRGSDFADSLTPSLPPPGDEPGPGSDPLEIAARGVRLEREGEAREAVSCYRVLVETPDSWVRLLGLMLRAWSEYGDEAAVSEASAAVDALGVGGDLGAHLQAKIATYAFNRGANDLARKALAEAIELAPRGGVLRRALWIEGLNAGLRSEWEDDTEILAEDQLVDYPWISFGALQSAQETLSSLVEARAKRLWSFQWGFGKTPLDDIVAAEQQASWAGALWKLRPIRKQLGAQLLGGAARNSTEWAWGVVMWTLGGGKNPERAYALAEPSFDEGSADSVVGTLLDTYLSDRTAHSVVSVAVEAWDELSEELLRSAVKRFEPVASDHPVAQEVLRLWAGYAARMTDEWLIDFEKFEIGTRAALIEMLGVGAVREFPSDAKLMVAETVEWMLENEEQVSAHVVALLGVATDGSGLDQDQRANVAARLGAEGLSRLSWKDFGSLVDADALDGARATLIEIIARESEEARQGQISFGAGDSRLSLGRIVADRGQADETAVGLLLDIASDPELPPEHVLGARNALTVIRNANLLSDGDLQRVRAGSDPNGRTGVVRGVSRELLAASRLRVLSLDLDEAERIALIELTRARDGKARHIALAGCAEAASSATESDSPAAAEDLGWALVGGLYDPTDEVVASTLRVFTPEIVRRFPGAGQVAMSRCRELLDVGDTAVRESVRAMAGAWSRSPLLETDRTIETLLARSARDRSWLVRNALPAEEESVGS